jgi:putative ABC transport system permease protein
VFSFVIQKMKSNLWKVLCLLLGCILVVGMFASIPIYTKGILQRMFIKQLEMQQTNEQIYSGYYSMGKTYQYATDTKDPVKERYLGTFTSMDAIRAQMTDAQKDMPYVPLMTAERIQLDKLFYYRPSVSDTVLDKISINGMSDFENHVSIIAGRMYAPTDDGTTFEAVVSESAMKEKGFTIGQIIQIKTDLYAAEESDALSVEIVGVVAASDPSDPYWYVSLDSYRAGIIMNYEVLLNEARTNLPRNLVEYNIWSIYDYHSFSFEDSQRVQSVYEESLRWIETTDKNTTIDCTFSDVIQGYPNYKDQLETTLRILFVPIILMLAFYIYMVSQLMVVTDKSNISIMESRGAGKRRIVLTYLIEYSIIAVISFITGPLLGLLMCRILGSSNGFLTFVGRTALPVSISVRALVYAASAMLFFIAVTLVPVFILARKGIVETKRTVSRRSKSPVWQRYFLDVILLGISLYAYLMMQDSLADEASFVSKNNSLLFLASTIFILGTGMLFLRIYPVIVRSIFYVGRKKWSPVFYTSFLQVSRTDGREQFLMLFIVLALSVGIFNANAARTINQNAEDEVAQLIGTDLVIQEDWTEYGSDGSVITSFNPTLDVSITKTTHYMEPDITKYEDMDGISNVTRVLNSRGFSTLEMIDKRVINIEIMGIDPYEFGQVAWTRSDILPYPINSYLNAMTQNSSFAVISEKIANSLGCGTGDFLKFAVKDGSEITFTVLAVVSYWPGLSATYITDEGVKTNNSFLIMNLDYYYDKNPMEPYEVWATKEEGVPDQKIYDQISSKNIVVESIASKTQSISEVKNDPQLQGLNGALSLGFIVSMLICAVGFLIYWIVSIQGRVLQFGIYRAMGMNKLSVLGIIGAEQVLISGVSILTGVLIGDAASVLYLPLFKILNRSDGTAIPFQIVSSASDYVKIFVILGIVLIMCFAILSRIMLHIRIDQAVKLGEE